MSEVFNNISSKRAGSYLPEEIWCHAIQETLLQNNFILTHYCKTNHHQKDMIYFTTNFHKEIWRKSTKELSQASNFLELNSRFCLIALTLQDGW